MKRIKTFALFEAEDWKSVDWDAKSEEMKKLAAELNIMFEDYGYEFFIMERTPGVGEAAGIIMQETILLHGQKSRWPISGPSERSAPIKRCLLREMIDQFIFNGRLDRDREALIIEYKNHGFQVSGRGSYPLSISFVSDAEDGKIKFSEHMRRVIQLGVPLTMPLEEFKNEFKIYVDSNITKIEKISASDNYTSWIPVSDPDDIELVEKIVQTVTKFQANRNALNVFLDGIGDSELLEKSGTMSDWLYNRMGIKDYLVNRGFSKEDLHGVEMARASKSDNENKLNIKEKEISEKMESLAMELNKTFINYGINFLPDSYAPWIKYHSKTTFNEGIVARDARLRHGSQLGPYVGSVWQQKVPEKFITTDKPPLLRKLICELIFGLREDDEKAETLGFGTQQGIAFGLRIIPSEENNTGAKFIEGAPGDHQVYIEIPVSVSIENLKTQIKKLIDESFINSKEVYLHYMNEPEYDDDGEEIEVDEGIAIVESTLEGDDKKQVLKIIFDIVSKSPAIEITDASKFFNEAVIKIDKKDLLNILVVSDSDIMKQIDPETLKEKGIDQDEINLLKRMRKRRKYM